MIDMDADFAFTNDYGKTAKGNYAAFYYKAIKNDFKSKQEGRDVYEDKLYILILCPGQKNTEVRRPARDQDKEDYAMSWQNFQAGKPEQVVGTPIDNFGLQPSRVAELKLLNIRTVEQLADMSDLSCQKIGIDANKLRERAQGFLKISKGSAEFEILKTENESLKRRLAELERLMVQSPSKAESTAQPRRRGRPKKGGHDTTDANPSSG